MAGVNKAIIVGHLGADPEVRTLENGTKVANITVATTESYKDKNTGERIDNTEWHRVSLWRGLADVAESYLKKGAMVYIEGKIETREYEKDGIKRWSTSIVARDLTMLGKKGDNDGSAPGGNASTANSNADQYMDKAKTETTAATTAPAPSAPAPSAAVSGNAAMADADDDLPF